MDGHAHNLAGLDELAGNPDVLTRGLDVSSMRHHASGPLVRGSKGETT